MRPSSLILLGVITLVQHRIAIQAQEILSFEPGGKQACADAIHQPVPGPGDNSRGFNSACDGRDLDIEKTRFAALSKSMDSAEPGQRVAFNALMVGFADFRDAHIGTEVRPCEPGAACKTMQAEKARVNLDFLQMAAGHPAAGLPHFTADQYAQSDSALNSEYQKVFTALPAACSVPKQGCVSQPAFRDTQRLWIRFRDAWVTFALLRWPEITSDSWLTYLTQQRTTQIETNFVQ